MPPLWSRLGTLAMPVRLLVGERDAKFVSLGRQMLDLLGPSSDLMLLPGGHRLPLESPAAVAVAIAERLASERLP
jgi:pimeloyl-ACP methyl ester carboxylesterase